MEIVWKEMYISDCWGQINVLGETDLTFILEHGLRLSKGFDFFLPFQFLSSSTLKNQESHRSQINRQKEAP